MLPRPRDNEREQHTMSNYADNGIFYYYISFEKHGRIVRLYKLTQLEFSLPIMIP